MEIWPRRQSSYSMLYLYSTLVLSMAFFSTVQMSSLLCGLFPGVYIPTQFLHTRFICRMRGVKSVEKRVFTVRWYHVVKERSELMAKAVNFRKLI